MKAIELSGVHLGRTVKSLVYPNKNKTAKPRRYSVGNGYFSAIETEYTIHSIYMHENGNILINSDAYLRPDTNVTLVDDGVLRANSIEADEIRSN